MQEEDRFYYSACLFVLDICVAQLQAAVENGNKSAHKTLNQLMCSLAKEMEEGQNGLVFWLPVLNAFYVVHVELNQELKEAYLNLANNEEEFTQEEETSHLSSIRDLIKELSDLSVFDIAENFFAQSYAMPPDFFIDLLVDLYSIEEGHDIALLTLLHPNPEVRQIVVSVLDQILPSVNLTPISLSRLRAIKCWYPAKYHEQFDYWIKQQRKRGVVFHSEIKTNKLQIKASEIDGGGAQGIFIHVRQQRKNRLCGLLYKQNFGIKEVWVTPPLNTAQIEHYYEHAFDGTVVLREVDISYIITLTKHFLATTLERGDMPDLHLLEIQETLGLNFTPEPLDIEDILNQLGVQISPFTNEVMNESLNRSKSWPKKKPFTESWFIENSRIDKLVNRCSSFVDGVKVCNIKEAMELVFAEELELRRDYWLFHFLWTALWLKVKARKNEKIWQDSFFIAYAINLGMPLKDIPIMHEICLQSVINSSETMQERRTHLN